MKIILEGVVGSHAYGLATPESDIDLRGAFCWPTEKILSLDKGAETIDRVNPDVCHHEVEKFVRLAANANPNILEMFWLDRYTQLTEEGQLLLNLKEHLLSQRVRKTYGGYAMAQIKRLKERGDGSFKSKLRKRREKHARHCFRLLWQGTQILSEGRLTVSVASYREQLFHIGTLDDDALGEMFTAAMAKMDATESTLPEDPDYTRINETLLTIREMNWSRDNH